MAVFLHNNRSITYQTELAPFSEDLLLLQGARFNSDYWRPVLEDLGTLPPAGGRIVTCEWASADADSVADRAEDIARLAQSVGLQNLHVVACDDAVEVVAELQKNYSGLIEKTLLFPSGGPKGEDLTRAVRAFSPI